MMRISELGPMQSALEGSMAQRGPARAPGTPRGSHAPRLPRSGERGLQPELCSLTVFFLATIFSSFLAILSSSSSWPMLARDAR